MRSLHTTPENRRLGDNDEAQRLLCHQLLDAIEAGDIEAVRHCYHPDARTWVNVSRQERTVDEVLTTLRNGAALHRRRTYDDRIVDTFDGGFLARYSINVVRVDGSRLCLWACIVAKTGDDVIHRLDEYLDAGKFAPTVQPDEAGSGGQGEQR